MNGVNGPAANRSTPRTSRGPSGRGRVDEGPPHARGGQPQRGAPGAVRVHGRVEALEARGVAADDDGVQRARVARGGRERGDGQAVRAEHGEPQLAGGARRRTWGRRRRAGSLRRRTASPSVASGVEAVGAAHVVVAAGVGDRLAARRAAGRTSPPANQAAAEHEERAPGVRREPRRDPHARHLRPPCSTAGRARSCASPSVHTTWGYTRLGSVRGHARRVITLSSLAVRPLATLVSRPATDNADRPRSPTRRPCRPSTPKPAPGPAGRSPRAG